MTTTTATLPPLPPGWTWSDPDPRYPSVRAPNGVDVSCSSVRQAVEIANTSGHLRPDPATPSALSSTTVDLSLTIPSPGEIPSLLSYGAQLVTLVSSQWRSTCATCQRVDEGRWEAGRPVLCVSADKYSTYVADGNDDPRGSAWSHSHLALRLDLEPGRACAAWWLAQQVDGLKGRGTSATLDFYARGARVGSPGWTLKLAGTNRGKPLRVAEVLFTPDYNGWQHYVHVRPELVGLDPDDPRTLADGSRWVDAEALRRLVLSMAGKLKNADQGGTR